MSHANRTLEKLSDESWELKLSVDSEVIETLKWVWTAEVSVEDGPKESTIAIGPATHTAVGMPDGDGTGDHSYTSRLTHGKNGIRDSEFESVSDQWEQECRKISHALDSSVINKRRALERQRSEQERKFENHQRVETYLDSLTNHG